MNRANGGSAGLANAAGRRLSRAQRWWASIMRPTWAVWRSPYRCISVPACANPGGVAIAVPLHISSSAPPEFESMLDEAAFLAPEGVVRPLQYLRSRTLARHTHAMLKGGATLVTSVSRARLASFRAQPVVVGGANGLRTVLRRALDRHGGLEHGAARSVPHRLAQHRQHQDFRHHRGHVSRRSGCSSRLLCGPHLVQQVEVLDNSPTTPHWPVRLTLKATSCGHRVLARQRPKLFPSEVSVGPQEERRLDLGSRGNLPNDLELAWAQLKQSGAASTTSTELGAGFSRAEAKGLSSSTFPSARLRARTRGGAAAGRLAAPLGGPGCGQPGCLEEGADCASHVSTFSPHGCLNLVARPWPLGRTLGVSITGGSGKRLVQSSQQGELDRSGQAGHAFHHASHAASGQCFGGRICTRLRAMGEGSLLGLCGHRALTKISIDNCKQGTLAAPELLAKQMETWLPLWLDGRRAAAKQLADQEEFGDPLPRPSLEDVDDVCKTYKSAAGLGHDCTNPSSLSNCECASSTCS